MKRSFALLLLTGLPTILFAQKQDNPSYQETVDWLSAKLINPKQPKVYGLIWYRKDSDGNVDRTTPYGYWYEATAVYFSGCTYELTSAFYHHLNNDNSLVGSSGTTTVDLTKLSPNVKPTYSPSTVQHQDSVTESYDYSLNQNHYAIYASKSDGKGDTFLISLPGANDALVQRVVKAFSHAIELCGGKQEAF